MKIEAQGSIHINSVVLNEGESHRVYDIDTRQKYVGSMLSYGDGVQVMLYPVADVTKGLESKDESPTMVHFDEDIQKWEAVLDSGRYSTRLILTRRVDEGRLIYRDET